MDSSTPLLRAESNSGQKNYSPLSPSHTANHMQHMLPFTHGMTNKWSYLTRTTPYIDNLLQPLEVIVRTKLSPAFTGRPPPNDTERDLLALPTRPGGIALVNPTKLQISNSLLHPGYVSH